MNYPDFNGKVVSFTISDNKYNHDFVNPSLEEQGGRLFVVGQVPTGATNSGWTDGKIAAIAWEQVIEYVVFDDLADYAVATKKSDDYEE